MNLGLLQIKGHAAKHGDVAKAFADLGHLKERAGHGGLGWQREKGARQGAVPRADCRLLRQRVGHF
jgi:hypothetical protein